MLCNKRGIDSDAADVKNIAGDRAAGSIIGAEFIPSVINKVPWPHSTPPYRLVGVKGRADRTERGDCLRRAPARPLCRRLSYEKG